METNPTAPVPVASTPTAPSRARRQIAQRWGGKAALSESGGFLAVPLAFLKYHAVIRPKLKPAEAMFVLQLMSYKWDENAPFPGYKTIAKRMGVSEVYARKIARGLEDKGLLVRRLRVSQTNLFDLQPLFDKLAEHVEKVNEAKSKATT